MSGKLVRDPIHVMSLATATFLAFGAVTALFKADLFWTAVGVWAFLLIISPYLKYGGRERSVLSWLLLLITLPYLASLVSGFGGPGLLPLTSPWYLVLSSLALFALCLVTIAYINSCTWMELNLKFALQVAFMFYASLVVLQGPVFYYSDLMLGTSIVPGNTELMAYITLATINGLILTVAFFVAARALAARGIRKPEGADQ